VNFDPSRAAWIGKVGVPSTDYGLHRQASSARSWFQQPCHGSKGLVAFASALEWDRFDSGVRHTHASQTDPSQAGPLVPGKVLWPSRPRKCQCDLAAINVQQHPRGSTGTTARCGGEFACCSKVIDYAGESRFFPEMLCQFHEPPGIWTHGLIRENHVWGSNTSHHFPPRRWGSLEFSNSRRPFGGKQQLGEFVRFDVRPQTCHGSRQGDHASYVSLRRGWIYE
jgi:hypothetical protein